MNLQRAAGLLILTSTLSVLEFSAEIPANSCDQEKSFGREDKTLFAKHCGLCHTLSGNWQRVGPSLSGLYERKQMVSGQPVTDENVRALIARGGPGLMPGFQYMLKPEQIDEIVRYIRENRCSDPSAAKGKRN